MKLGTVALIVEASPRLKLVEMISDDQEIEMLEESMRSGDPEPLEAILSFRDTQKREEEEFADYIEELLSQPFVRPEIQEHGVQWLKSKMKIEQYQKSERDAAQVIAGYAMKVLEEKPDQTDFILAGPSAQVRVRVFIMKQVAHSQAA